MNYPYVYINMCTDTRTYSIDDLTRDIRPVRLLRVSISGGLTQADS